MVLQSKVAWNGRFPTAADQVLIIARSGAPCHGPAGRPQAGCGSPAPSDYETIGIGHGGNMLMVSASGTAVVVSPL
jgi:hypothetical protein